MRKIASIILTLTVIAMSSQSCMKEIAGEAQSLAGTWFRTDEDKSTEYITFEKGKVEHWLSTKKLYIVDNKAWGHSAAHLTLQTRTLYSVQGSAIFAIPDNELLWSFTHSSEGEMTLTNPESSQTSTWHKVDGLEKSPYTRLSVSQTKFDLSFSECNRNHEIRLSADRILPQILELGVELEHAIAFAFNNGLATVSGSDWLHITGTTESGFTFCPEINDKTPRNGYLYINFPGADEQTIAVSVQSGEDISADTDKTQIGYAAGTHKITLNLNTEVEISCTETWISNIHISNGNLYFTASENNTGSTRFGRIILSNPDAVEDLVIHITQTYTASTLTLSHESKEFDYNAHSSNMFSYSIENMHEGLSVEITCDADWCKTHRYENTVSYWFDENNSGNDRTARITVKYGDIEKVFTVVQSYTAPKITIDSPDYIEFKHDGGERAISYNIQNPRKDGQTTVQLKTSWTSEWLTFEHDPSSSEITVHIANNNDIEGYYSGTIVITYLFGTISVSQNILIKQKYNAPTLTLETENIETHYFSSVVSIPYTLSNPRKDSEIIFTNHPSWVRPSITENNIALEFEQNTDLSPRSGEIQLVYGNQTNNQYLTQTIHITQNGIPTDLSSDGTANCYIIQKSGLYMFKTVKGNSNKPVGEVASTEVLWESFGTDITPNVGDLVKQTAHTPDGYIIVQIPPVFKEGNAVVAAKDARGVILWSWHIWLVEDTIVEYSCYDEDHISSVGIMMDRNIGAVTAENGVIGSLGLVFQCGRKDPFICSIKSREIVMAKTTINWPKTIARSETTGTEKYAHENPTTFIAKYNDNWLCDISHNRWANSGSNKTEVDPCPVGWLVPDSKFWIDAMAFDKEYKRTYGTQYDETGIIVMSGNISCTCPYDDKTHYPSFPLVPGIGNRSGGQDLHEGSLPFNVNNRTGYYWTSEKQTVMGMITSFYNDGTDFAGGDLYPKKTGAPHSSAFPVRCMKE